MNFGRAKFHCDGEYSKSINISGVPERKIGGCPKSKKTEMKFAAERHISPTYAAEGRFTSLRMVAPMHKIAKYNINAYKNNINAYTMYKKRIYLGRGGEPRYVEGFGVN